VLRGTKTLRLTRRESDRWVKITGLEPATVRSEVDLRQFVRRCKRHFWGISEDTRFLHFLIDKELRSNLAQEPIDVEGHQQRLDEASDGTGGVRSRW
jgi:hypothetical protein